VAKHTCILPLNGSYVGVNGTLVWSPKVTLLFSASPLATSCADMPVLLLVLVLVSILVAISSAGGAPLRKHTVAHAAFTNPSLLLPPPREPRRGLGNSQGRPLALEQFAKKKYRTGCTPSIPLVPKRCLRCGLLSPAIPHNHTLATSLLPTAQVLAAVK